VLVDEAQFLSRAQVFQLAAICDELRVPVLAYGLRTISRPISSRAASGY
jgi:thymidine kinase